MSPEEQKQLIHAVIDVIFNQQDLDRLEEFFTEDFYNHDGFPGAPTGPGRVSRLSADDENSFSGSDIDPGIHAV